jgi:hypothetical protein
MIELFKKRDPSKKYATQREENGTNGNKENKILLDWSRRQEERAH